MRISKVRVNRRVLIISAIASVVLFLIAAPFGHDHHGVGRVMSDIFWPLFLISAVVFVALCLFAAASTVLRRQAS